MRDAALLAVWLIGLFGLIGCVMAAVARFVRKDSIKYDKQFTWSAYPNWEGEAAKRTVTDTKLDNP
jgi:hypothetical protein